MGFSSMFMSSCWVEEPHQPFLDINENLVNCAQYFSFA
jgi:hypothetical protein